MPPSLRSSRFALGAQALVLAAVAGPTLAGSNVDPDHRQAWCENIGWTDWRPGVAGGANVGTTFLSGFLWSESVGWIQLGSGSPADGIHYRNETGSEFGVNVEPDSGNLFGFAWGENIGWINFDTRSAGTARARVDLAAGRLRGFAWGENVGWMNLDDATRFVGISVKKPVARQRPGDCNQDGVLDISDGICLLNFLFLGSIPRLPCGDGTVGDGANVQLLDSNGDAKIDLSDAVRDFAYLFLGAPPPVLGEECVAIEGCPGSPPACR